jgi:initiation factor 1A
MATNTHGGKGHKRFARKDKKVDENYVFRYVAEDGEMYAAVTKCFGGNYVEVICNDGKKRMGYLSGKMRSRRNRKEAHISLGTKLIIGLRDWQTTKDKGLEKCDVLEVYSNDDEMKLRRARGINWKALTGEGDDEEDQENECGFEFEEL